MNVGHLERAANCGKSPTVKVADFGLAKVVDSVTFLRTMCGTPAYLAPEVVTQQNREGYDHLVDIPTFALTTPPRRLASSTSILDFRTPSPPHDLSNLSVLPSSSEDEAETREAMSQAPLDELPSPMNINSEGRAQKRRGSTVEMSRIAQLSIRIDLYLDCFHWD
ncbi:hypothetical protein C8R48DRAFT_675641 [Suillus tomentosus]|nr:hypothetical protein C8R48DRAFT_675641 [Suillus tomentosus]